MTFKACLLRAGFLAILSLPLMANAQGNDLLLVETHRQGRNSKMYRETAGEWKDAQHKSWAKGLSPKAWTREADAAGGALVAKAVFTPEIPEAGTYALDLTWPDASNALGVSVVVTASGNPIDTKRIDFVNGSTANKWTSIGTYELPAGTGTTIEIDGATSTGPGDPAKPHALILDAIRLRPRSSRSSSGSSKKSSASASRDTADPFAAIDSDARGAGGSAPSSGGGNDSNPFGALDSAGAPPPAAQAPATGGSADPFAAVDGGSSQPVAAAPPSGDDPFAAVDTKSAPPPAAAATPPVPENDPFGSITAKAAEPTKAPWSGSGGDPFAAMDAGANPAKDTASAPPAAQSGNPFETLDKPAATAAAPGNPFGDAPPPSAQPGNPFGDAPPAAAATPQPGNPFADAPAATAAPGDPFAGMDAKPAAGDPFAEMPASTPAPVAAVVTPTPEPSPAPTMAPPMPTVEAPKPALAINFRPDLATALKEATALRRNVIVFFMTDEKPSEKFRDRILADAAVQKALDKLVPVTIDLREDAETAAKYNVSSAPYGVVIAPEGFTIGHISPTTTAKKFEAELKRYAR